MNNTHHIAWLKGVAHVISSTHEVCGSTLTLSPPFPSTSSSSHSSFISCTSSCTFVASLCTPPKRVWTLLTRPTTSQGYEPNAYDFKETYAESYTELLTSLPFSKQGFPEDPDYDDTALEDMLREAHRVHVHHSQREDLSVSLSSSSMSERTERLLGERTVRPVEQRNQEAQIKILLDKQKEQILAECQTRSNRHEFQAAYQRSLLKLCEIVDSQQELHCAQAEELQRRYQQLLHGQLLQQNSELREAHLISLTEMEELKKFQISDSIARRRLVEKQDTILKLTGRIQDLLNEINCMSDSKVEGCWISSQWKFSRYQSTSVIPTHGISGNVFCKSRCVIISTFSSRIASVELINHHRHRNAPRMFHLLWFWAFLETMDSWLGKLGVNFLRIWSWSMQRLCLILLVVFRCK